MEPWFDGNTVGALLGSSLGIIGGTIGAVGGTLACKGKRKRLVIGLFYSITIICSLLLVAGITAKLLGQPYSVWYALVLSGMIGVVVFGTLTPTIKKRYREAELRGNTARDAHC